MRALMKTPGLTFAVVLLLVSCARTDTQQSVGKLAGTWEVRSDLELGVHFKSTTSVASTGAYVCQQTISSDDGRAVHFTVEGVYVVNDGIVTDTVTKHSKPDFAVPCVFHARVLRIDDREFVIRNETEGTKTEMIVMRRIKS